MYKSIIISSTLFMALLIMLVPLANPDNIFSNSNVIGEAYGDKYQSYYPTNDYKYECKKGPFAGFFVESVEFCDPELPVKDPIVKKDKKVPVKNPIVNIEKKLFVCENAQNQPNPSEIFFQCTIEIPDFVFLIAGPDSGHYIPCSPELCRGIDESDFGAQIFKDVVTIPALSPQGTPVNLDKFHYTVTETDIGDRIKGFEPFFGANCDGYGFDTGTVHTQFTEDLVIVYDICTQYVGDCEGTIHPGEVKTCTIENYIWSGNIRESPNTAAGVTTTGTTTTQSNNAITTTPTTTQSSNNVVGAPQSSNVGVPTTLSSSSSTSSPLLNILPSNPN